jgi:deferrochelatase/peroxidase EfeB
MGRWPDGTALTPETATWETFSPSSSPPTADYQFALRDSNGQGCPFGAHIRRANPRDALNLNASADATPDASNASWWKWLSPKWRSSRSARELSKRITSRHRILRRGIPYGGDCLLRGDNLKGLEALVHEPKAPSDTAQRGLLFISINANISRQFEFIQQTWLNNPKLEGYYDERDPIASVRESGGRGATHLTIPKTFPHRRLDIHSFVTVRGGAYFFLPSVSALEFLASCEPPPPSSASQDSTPAST